MKLSDYEIKKPDFSKWGGKGPEDLADPESLLRRYGSLHRWAWRLAGREFDEPFYVEEKDGAIVLILDWEGGAPITKPIEFRGTRTLEVSCDDWSTEVVVERAAADAVRIMAEPTFGRRTGPSIPEIVSVLEHCGRKKEYE